jgi:hydrogenase-4 component F
LGGWLALDAVGRLILNIVSGVFLAVSRYSIVYLRREAQNAPAEEGEDAGLVNAPEAVFTGCTLAAMATMTMISLSHHLGLLWVAVEGTTLATAPLLYFHKHSRSLEATWKYLLICSVGIALALLGNFFLIVAANENGQESIPLVLSDLVRNAHLLNVPWLKAAFLFLLVGYGTKMGLAPMHTWLPDAHSEAPSPVSALLSGVQLNCAFLGILRIQQVMVAAGLGSFCQGPLIALGIISMVVAGIFILGQEDFKRMLAYSSVEHMGILAFALGLGGLGAFGCLLHMLNNALAKSMMFLLAENIRGTYRSKSTWVIKGISHVLPVSGFLWIAGFLALAGFPPFGLFLSEFTILRAALDQHHGILAAAFLALLSLCFVGMATITLRMALGKADPEIAGAPRKEAWLSILPPIMLFTPLLFFGLYLPSGLRHLLQTAAESLGGK